MPKKINRKKMMEQAMASTPFDFSKKSVGKGKKYKTKRPGA